MDERKWGKIPTIAADVFFIDTEDTVAPEVKEAARSKIVSALKDRTHFGGRQVAVRINNLSTPWGAPDLEAIAGAGAPVIVYPKVRSGAEIREVRALLERFNPTPQMIVIIETPQAVLRLEDIASCEGISALLLGIGDLALETGTSMFNGSSTFDDGFVYARSKTLMAARAFGLEAIEPLLVPDLKDFETVRSAAKVSCLFGFDSNLTFYPPHVEIINEVRTPTAEQVVWNRRVIEAYEDALTAGKAAVTLDGKWLTVLQYAAAKREFATARALGLAE
jgi:citrate lyase beta subunit